MTAVHITRDGTKFKVSDIELPDSTAGEENIYEIQIVNNTNYDIENFKIVPKSPFCTVTHGKLIMANSTSNGKLIFKCPDEIESDVVQLEFEVEGLGKLRKVP